MAEHVIQLLSDSATIRSDTAYYAARFLHRLDTAGSYRVWSRAGGR
jgi:hypothetical protein